jgi:A/G-specific adenine glycosylase
LNDKFQTKKDIFQAVIIGYWKDNGRHDLPWRKTNDPWKLLLAEILLRKTTSKQVLPIYKILVDYSPLDLVNLQLKELQEILRPIGMSVVRATQLKDAANYFVSTPYIEKLNDDDLRLLKGVGKYISNMVRCISIGVAVPGLDANMIRVLSRFFGFVSTRKRPREDPNFWKFAESLVPQDYCREFNWGVLDFGAEICTFHRPRCLKCPLKSHCSYYQDKYNAPGDENNG